MLAGTGREMGHLMQEVLRSQRDISSSGLSLEEHDEIIINSKK